MRIKPVKSYKSPKYPPKELFIKNPSLLSEYAPMSWKTKAVVAGALLAFVFFGGRHLVNERKKIAGQINIIQNTAWQDKSLRNSSRKRL